ncbi:secreted frizzled-related protein 2-like [Aplochiton taeniatus]
MAILLFISALFVVSRASNTSPEFASIGYSSSVRSVCKPIPSTMSLCHGIGYREMRLPNLLGHDSLKEAQQQSAAWLPLVSKLCHKDTKKFLCSLFAPVCLPELTGPVSPCQGLCEAVRDGCVPVMNAFGFPWPEMFNCTRFPRGSNLCIPPTGAERRNHNEEKSKGTVICDACSLAAEGEKDIVKDFCSSPYAFKLRLGSVSVVDGDRRLVPQGRSRILRWGGGGAERAEGIGGAMAHSALWLSDGATCTCPALDGPGDGEAREAGGRSRREKKAGEEEEAGAGGKRPQPGGWYLGLAKAQEGRLVLSRLVKWIPGDKELKKFIRSLLKQPC